MLQVYLQDEPSLQGFMQQVQDYSQPGAECSEFRDSFNQSMAEHLTRFTDLTDEQRSLLLSARKEPGKYVEGGVLADNLDALFRSVPPPLSLALTEPH